LATKPSLLGATLRRLALAFATLFAISVIAVLATNVLPGDPARKALGLFATPERLAEFRERQGLDEPLVQRYVDWAGNLVTGDWGDSLVDNRDVADRVLPRALRSLVIATLGFLIALPVALALGVYAARRSGRRSDVALSSSSVLVASMPEFLVGLLLILLFGVTLGVLPVDSTGAGFGSFATRAEAYVMPTIALALLAFPYLFRMVRATVRDTLHTPYVRSADLRGVSPRSLVWNHVMPNASLPLMSAIALTMAELFGGVIIIESVFSFPGMGQLFVEGVRSGDVPMVQALSILIGAVFVFVNLVADLAAYLLNPRLRTT
jgi:peptide/nickel transport system permease protein